MLRSTEGIERGDDQPSSTPGNGGGIHVDAGDPDRAIGWMARCLPDLRYGPGPHRARRLNELEIRHRLQNTTWTETGEVEETLLDFTDALGQSSHRDWRGELDRQCAAVIPLRMRADGIASGPSDKA